MREAGAEGIHGLGLSLARGIRPATKSRYKGQVSPQNQNSAVSSEPCLPGFVRGEEDGG